MSMIDDALAGLAKGAAAGTMVMPGIGTGVGALLGVALNVAPGAAHWLGGTADVAAKAVQAVQAVTGTTDPAAAQAALDRDPGLTGQLRVQLAQIAADARAAERQADLDQQAATLADVADARHQTVTLAQAGSPLAWGSAVVSTVISLGFFASFGLLIYGPVPSDNGQQAMLNILTGAMAAGFTAVIGYWLGSSAGSDRKTTLLSQSVPAAMLPKPAKIEPAN